MNGREHCVMCKPNQENISNIHVSFLYLEAITALAIAECYLGDTYDTTVDYVPSII
jgi:hypothetical protein